MSAEQRTPCNLSVEKKSKRSACHGIKALLTGLADRYRFTLTFGLIVASSIFLFSAASTPDHGDIEVYRRIADKFLDHGLFPYRDQIVEYPPYAVLIFLFPRLFEPQHYYVAFFIMVLCGDSLLKLLLFRIGAQNGNSLRSFLPLLFYCVGSPFMRSIYLHRYDAFPALICLLTIYLCCENRQTLSGFSLALGVGTKLYPILFLPTLFILSLRQRKARRFIAGFLVGSIPIALLSFIVPWWEFLSFHTARGLQVESSYAALLWLGRLLGLWEVTWVRTRASFELNGFLPWSILPIIHWTFICAVAISTALTSWVGFRMPMRLKDSYRTAISPWELARVLLFPLLNFVVFNQILSPQYMIWLLPLAAIASLTGEIWTVSLILAAAMLTPFFYPVPEYFVAGLTLFQTTALVGRNMVLLLASILAFKKLLKSAMQPEVRMSTH